MPNGGKKIDWKAVGVLTGVAGIVVSLIVGLVSIIWAGNDTAIADLKKADTAITEKVDSNTADISEIKTDIGKIETAQTAIKEDVKEIKDQLETDRKERREDMKELKELIRAKNGSPP